MIEIAELKDSDIGRRVVWTVAPDVENPAKLAAWTDDTLVLGVFDPNVGEPGVGGLRMISDVDPAQVRFADRLARELSEEAKQ